MSIFFRHCGIACKIHINFYDHYPSYILIEILLSFLTVLTEINIGLIWPLWLFIIHKDWTCNFLLIYMQQNLPLLLKFLIAAYSVKGCRRCIIHILFVEQPNNINCCITNTQFCWLWTITRTCLSKFCISYISTTNIAILSLNFIT